MTICIFKIAQSTILLYLSRVLPLGWRDGLPENLEDEGELDCVGEVFQPHEQYG